MWMHDTFCWGDDILEHLVVNDHINELWTLSDFHNNYVSYCTHPTLRNYEALRNHLWITRNGMVKFTDKIDLKKKDPNLFVFNSNMSKGLNSLLNHVWPRVKQRLPDARLCVIGGRYKLGKAFAEDTEESEFQNLVSPHLNDPTINFTGIITLEEISKIYSKATYLIYPATFPETYGISTLEALYHNMTTLSCKFGALEETARPGGYLIPYAAMANALKGDIDVNIQSDIFVDMVVKAYNDKKNRKESIKQLDEIKDIAGWDTVALEWKQHIYSKLGKYLSREESQQALYSKYKYQRIFGRRTSTSEQWIAPAQNAEQKIVVVSPFYNAQDYIAECINSVAAQLYDNYEHWLIDDCSTDDTVAVTLKAIGELPENIQSKFKLISNSVNYGAVYNQIQKIHELNDSDIVMLLDGDDKLKNSPDIFTYYNEIHQNNDFTYGSCWSIVDNIPLISQPYPEHVKKNKAYKQHKFNWILPYTHLRTLKAKLLKYEPDETFIDPTTEKWFKAGGDLSTFYSAIEACDPEKVHVVTDIMYMYNDASPLNDYKVNSHEQTKTVNMISSNHVPPVGKKKILIAIPCKNDIEADTFKSIYDLEVPEGYETEFQYFYGYAVDQVRNLIAHWVINAYDYLLAIDHDVVFEKDTLKKMLAHDKPLVSGVYRQRMDPPMIEIYDHNMVRMDISNLTGSLQEIGGCGFGCVLVKREVFASMPYPWFVYHQSLNHNETFSEDLDFCRKARDRGYKLYADSSILCKHIGQRSFEVELPNIRR
jgi:glycosyltransferase involved in cell wall biosynthesis/GT2 family glycosyltransferase